MVKVGQIGLGDWGKNLFRNFISIPDCDMEICSDLNQKAMDNYKQLFPGVKFTSDWMDVLKTDIDAVIIATPPEDHYPMGKEALEKGKHVFIEKPITLTSHEAQELIDLSKQNDKILMVGYILLYHPALKLLKRYIDQNDLGKVYYFYATRLNLGKVRTVENALWSFASHDISMILYLSGKYPKMVSATGASYIQGNIEDVSFLTMFFSDDLIAHIHTSWLDPHKTRKLTVVGERKMMVFDDTQPSEKIRVYDKGVDRLEYETFGEYLSLRSGDIYVPKIEAVEPLKSECLHFIKSIQNGTQPLSDGKSGYDVVRILEAAQKSMESNGTPIEV